MDDTLIRTIWQECNIAVMITDGNLIVQELHGLLAIIDTDEAGGRGRSLLDLFPELLGNRQDLDEILAGNLPNLKLEYVNRETVQGGIRYLSMQDLPYQNAAGKIIGIVHLVQDITSKGELEQQITQNRNQMRLLKEQIEHQNLDLAASNKELEAFAYSVSHDLRAPLRAIDGYSRILLMDYAQLLGDEGRMFIENIRLSAQNMDRLTLNLLELSRVARAEINRSWVDLSAVVQTILNLYTRQEPARSATLQVQPNMAAYGDPELLRIAMENLLSNAWKYTSHLPTALIEVGCTQTNQGNTYYVRDNGIGFDMRYVAKLFQPFQRLHPVSEYEGTGVGLATVQRIVQRHGGSVWAEAAVNAGATFYFTLKA